MESIMSKFHDDIREGYLATEGEAGDVATYRRGNESAPVIVVIAGGSSPTMDAGGRVMITQRQNELLLRPELLKFAVDGPLTRPVNGDEITIDDSGRRFHVVADKSTKSCWRFSDGGQTFYRITVDELRPS